MKLLGDLREYEGDRRGVAMIVVLFLLIRLGTHEDARHAGTQSVQGRQNFLFKRSKSDNRA
jgi:hypothetical protein